MPRRRNKNLRAQATIHWRRNNPMFLHHWTSSYLNLAMANMHCQQASLMVVLTTVTVVISAKNTIQIARHPVALRVTDPHHSLHKHRKVVDATIAASWLFTSSQQVSNTNSIYTQNVWKRGILKDIRIYPETLNMELQCQRWSHPGKCSIHMVDDLNNINIHYFVCFWDLYVANIFFLWSSCVLVGNRDKPRHFVLTKTNGRHLPAWPTTHSASKDPAESEEAKWPRTWVYLLLK